jgi:Ca2+-dependent lipid-binding protein
MTRLLKEIKDDLSFIQSHSLQPQWYKASKILILVGFLIGYYYFFGFVKTVIFFVAFMFLMLLVHLVYRFKTDKFQRSWLDFVVEKTDEGVKAKRIGKFYYASIILNAIISAIVSQLL